MRDRRFIEPYNQEPTEDRKRATDPERSCDTCTFYSAKVFYENDDPTVGKCFRNFDDGKRTVEWTHSDWVCDRWEKFVRE